MRERNDRDDRLAAALRENLKRRKAQAREREPQPQDRDDGPGEATPAAGEGD